MIKCHNDSKLTIEKINNAIEADDFDIVYKYKDLLMELFNELKDSDIYVSLVKAVFYKEKYQDVIDLATELYNLEYERYEIIYYVVFSSIAINDLYVALSILKRYKIMNEEDVKVLWNDEAIYSTVCNCELGLKKASISVKFLRDYSRALSDDIDYPVIAIYDLINTLNEVGFDKDIVRELTDIANMLFEIKLN